ALLHQEIFEFSRRLHGAEVEARSLHLQLAECRWAFNEMQKDAEKAQRLQTQLNELQLVSTTCFSFQKINKDNVHEELDNALQREREAKLLLQEHQRRLQELTNRLRSQLYTDVHRSTVSSVPLMNLTDAAEELRKRDQALDHQNKLLKDMEQDQQRLWDTLEEAEHALEQEVK
ncbi:CC171 protein, partial [Prunella himalayana]|nr:CC171 protein [Prunella himalayana]